MTKDSIQTIGQKLKVTKMHPDQSIGYAASYPAYPLNPPLPEPLAGLWVGAPGKGMGIGDEWGRRRVETVEGKVGREMRGRDWNRKGGRGEGWRCTLANFDTDRRPDRPIDRRP